MKRSIHAVFYFLPVKDGPYKTKLEVTFSVTYFFNYLQHIILLKALPIADFIVFSFRHNRNEANKIR